jgi:uncharacterized protein (DUF1778 family)
MGSAVQKRDIPISMRLREDDLGIIDRGAAIDGLSRTEFVRQAALERAQLAILNETVVRMSPQAFDHFIEAIEKPPRPMSSKMIETLRRSPPWKRK